MRLVSPLLKHVVYPGLSKAGYLRRVSASRPAVLTYHGVLPAGCKSIDPSLDGNLVSAGTFRRQLRFAQDQYNVIPPREFLRWCTGEIELPPRSILLTCDDGLRNSLSEMLPILQEFDLKCLFFVTGASLRHASTMLWYEELYLMFMAAPEGFALEVPEVGTNARAHQQDKRILWWELVKKLSQCEPTRRSTVLETIRMQLGLSERWGDEFCEDPTLSQRFCVLNDEELRRLAEAGMSIGAHTLSHPMLSQSPPDVAWREISESKLRIEQALGEEVWALAYPFGDLSSVTSREIDMAEAAGFKAAFLNVGGSFGRETSKFALPRVHVTAGTTLAELEAHISGFHRSMQEFFRPAGAAGLNA